MKKLSVIIISLIAIALLIFPAIAATNDTAFSFKPGEISEQKAGRLGPKENIWYEFYAAANQTATIVLKSASGNATLSIADANGKIYLPREKNYTYFTMLLPQTGKYFINVMDNGYGTDFSLQLTIPPSNQPNYPTLVPQPQTYMQNGGAITFGAGETSAQINSTLSAASCVRYSFYAGNNYNLMLVLNSQNKKATIGLSDATGREYLSNSMNYTFWRMGLPTNMTTYFVDVCNPGAETTDFHLNLIIPARITLTASTQSATKTGAIKELGVVSYTLYAAAGQWMQVSLNTGATPKAFLRISGMDDGVVYLDHNSYQTSWSGYLPATQDYLIDIISAGEKAVYQLNIVLK